MSSANSDRFTYLTADDHQRWLWFTHIYCPCLVILAGCLRLRRKHRRLGLDDGILLVAHFLYIAYWILTLLALLSKLGKSENVTSSLDRAKASKLLFTSRIVLVLILCLVHASIIALIRMVFSADFKTVPIWFRTVLAATVCEAVLSSVLISTSCSSGSLLDAPYHTYESTCPHNIARWIVVTAIESIFEVILLIPVATVVWTVQVSTRYKLQAIRAFASRLLIWIFVWLHASVYVSFLNSATSGAIHIVPTVVTEELWAASALVSASLPLLHADMMKLSTYGISLDAQFSKHESQNAPTGSARSHPSGNSKNNSRHDDKDRSSTAQLQTQDDGDDDIQLRPEYDRREYSTSVHAQSSRRAKMPFVLPNKNKRGIVREVGFEMTNEPRAL